MQYIKGLARMFMPGAKRQRDDSPCEGDICCITEPGYMEYLKQAHDWFIHAYPRGFGKRAKRSCMRKALRCYKLAYRSIKNTEFKDNLDKLDAKFKVLFFIGTAYRALCEEDMLTHTLDRLTTLMLYEMKDTMIDEYDLATMGLHASTLVSMYRTGYPASKLAEAREMMRSMEETDPEAFDKMPLDFVQSHYHYSGLLNLIEGRLVEAQKEFNTSLDIKARRYNATYSEDKFDKAFEIWTKKLLTKTERKLRVQAAHDAEVFAMATKVTEEDLDAFPTNEATDQDIDPIPMDTGVSDNEIIPETDNDNNHDMVMVDKIKDD